MNAPRVVGRSDAALVALVLLLVASAFTTVYITQPVLPVLQAEFGVSPSVASLSVSVVILAMAATTLPIGMLADRYPARALMVGGGCIVAIASGVCAVTTSFATLVAMRFVQGMFLPTLTTCVAAWLSRTLEPRALNVAMGSYVAATVAGGLGGRLLGGWIHPPLHWRYAFATSGTALAIITMLTAWRMREPGVTAVARAKSVSFARLATRRAQMLGQLAAFGAFGAFSTLFNYFPFYLSEPRWGLSTATITSLYLVYVAGLVMGPVSGRISNRFGNGAVMTAGALLLGASLLATLVMSIGTLIASLVGICAGFFAIHAAAVGALNRGLSGDRGKANALYTLFYYVGGAAGIAAGGQLYDRFGWPGVLAVSLAMTALAFAVGVIQWRDARFGVGAKS